MKFVQNKPSMVLGEEHLQIVKEMIALNYTFRRISNILNEKGYTTKRGAKLRPSVLSAYIRSDGKRANEHYSRKQAESDKAGELIKTFMTMDMPTKLRNDLIKVVLVGGYYE